MREAPEAGQKIGELVVDLDRDPYTSGQDTSPPEQLIDEIR
jgi:hypothetical protein